MKIYVSSPFYNVDRGLRYNTIQKIFGIVPDVLGDKGNSQTLP